MKTAGIDTSVYTNHSTRSATTSYLASKQVDVNELIQMFFNRNTTAPFNFGNILLEATVSEK